MAGGFEGDLSALGVVTHQRKGVRLGIVGSSDA